MRARRELPVVAFCSALCLSRVLPLPVLAWAKRPSRGSHLSTSLFAASPTGIYFILWLGVVGFFLLGRFTNQRWCGRSRAAFSPVCASCWRWFWLLLRFCSVVSVVQRLACASARSGCPRPPEPSFRLWPSRDRVWWLSFGASIFLAAFSAMKRKHLREKYNIPVLSS